MKKLCLILVGLFFLVLISSPGYCFFGSYLTKREILSWNKHNSGKVKVVLPKTSVFTHYIEMDKVPGYPKLGKKKEFHSNNVCFPEGVITNNSDNIIKQLIIPFIVLSGSKEVHTENLLLNVTVYPSATVKIDGCYELPWFGDGASELVAIKGQLGESYGWTHGKIIIITDTEDAPYNPHVLSDTTKHETLAKFEKWS